MKKLRLSFNAPVTLTFVFLCFAATLSGVLSGGVLSQMFFTTYRMQFLNPMSWLRCFSHTIGHVSWQHFFSNMMYLILLGPILEEKYGKKVLVSVILCTGMATTIAVTFLFPNTGVIGASGVVFAFILLASFTSFDEGTIPVTFILVFVFYIGQEVVNGLAVNDNISQMGHILGGMVGSISGFVNNRKSKKTTE